MQKKIQDLKYTEILSANKELAGILAKQTPKKIVVLSNIITAQLNQVLEYVIRQQNVFVQVVSGDYDNIVQDSGKFADADVVIIFWEVANLIDGLQYKANGMTPTALEALIDKTKQEILLVFEQLAHAPLVIFNQFSSLIFNQYTIKSNQLDQIAKELNEHLQTNLPKNSTIIPIDKIFAQLSIGKSTDLRYYYSSKALYTIDFYKQYTLFIAPILLSVYGKTKKALILDCDNTLWKGIVGEDGVEGIALSSQDKGGVVFEEIHYLVNQLAQEGVIIGLCSKNNEADVAEVFEKREDFALSNESILIKKVNWLDKVTNLQNIAEELNIGIDSLVFIDDSTFEINHVQEKLAAVTALQVPTALYAYPTLLRENLALFYKHRQTQEDQKRLAMYKQEAIRKDEQRKFTNIEDYLTSLELELNIAVNDLTTIERAAQLTQKTNQFNLTTRRYTETDLQGFIDTQQSNLYTFKVADKFGDYGMTGLALVHFANQTATIDTLLMSCRVLGRNIEKAFLNFILNHLQQQGINYTFAAYLKTLKNGQVKDFYENFAFDVLQTTEEHKDYCLNMSNFKYQLPDYIKVLASI